MNYSELEELVLQVIRNHPEVIWESLQVYQEEQSNELQKVRNEILQESKTQAQALIGSSPVRGEVNSDIVLFQFSDFQNPLDARAQEELDTFMDKHQDKVAMVHKHFPLTEIHPQAQSAAQAAWAAQQQGKFWQFAQALYQQQNHLGEERYRDTAMDLDLDLEQFDRDRESKAAAAAVEQDRKLGSKIGISQTPFFVLNGEIASGALTVVQFEKMLEKVIK